MNARAAIGGVLLLLTVVVPTRAHHAFSAEFDAERPVQLRGTIERVEFINPHSWFHIDVREDDGTVSRWMVEGGTPNALFSLTPDELHKLTGGDWIDLAE